MSAEQRGADVRPIFRRGDRVIVKLSSDFYVLVVQASELDGGELWLYARMGGSAMPIPATRVVRRLAPGEAFTWSMVR